MNRDIVRQSDFALCRPLDIEKMESLMSMEIDIIL